MTAESAKSVTRTFKYSFPTCTNEDVFFRLEVPVQIPHEGAPGELLQRVVNMFHIPVYLEGGMLEKLLEFVSVETERFHNERDEALLNQLKGNEVDVDGLIKQWEKLFKENVMEYAEQRDTSELEILAAAYHKLVHSPALEGVLQAEDACARAYCDTAAARDADLAAISHRQTEEMEELLSSTTDEAAVNGLCGRHAAERAAAAARWGSQLEALARAQRDHHRAWLLHAAVPTPCESPTSPFPPEPPEPPAPPQPPARARAPPTGPRLEESFTIHLGSQLKQTHNIRIVAADLAELCALHHADPRWRARRGHTALALYSSSLAGAVLPWGGRNDSEGSLPAAAAAAGPDHHFPPLREQLAKHQKHTSAGGAGGAGCAGDVIVTRHGNMADAHVLFHLHLGATSPRAGVPDITSRHPAILGLRNVLKAACAHDVTTVALPLLLLPTHHCSEEMTAAWCVRRAELVLKCVKGFVLEAAGWGGTDLATLQFAVPRDIQPEVFATLAQLLPTIFRISNPVKFKAPSTHTPTPTPPST